MSIKTVLQKYFENLFIAVMFNDNECVIYGKVYKNGLIQHTFTKTFTVELPFETLNKHVEEYLLTLQDEYRFVYITYLLDGLGQGAFEGVKLEDFEKFSVDKNSVYHLPMKNKWSIYASFIEVKWAQGLFEEAGLDFVFSPFMVLNEFIATKKQTNKSTCYILNCQNFFALAIVKESQLLFGALFKIQTESVLQHSDEVNDWENEQKEEEIISQSEIPELGLNDEQEAMEEMTDLSALDDLNDLQSTDSFSDIDDKTIGYFNGLEEMKEEDISLELYGRDLMVYKYLRSSLEEYYHNTVYTSEFVEEIVIFDDYEMSSDLIRQLEDELMMDVEIHKVSVPEKMNDLAIQEVFK